MQEIKPFITLKMLFDSKVNDFKFSIVAHKRNSIHSHHINQCSSLPFSITIFINFSLHISLKSKVIFRFHIHYKLSNVYMCSTQQQRSCFIKFYEFLEKLSDVQCINVYLYILSYYTFDNIHSNCL